MIKWIKTNFVFLKAEIKAMNAYQMVSDLLRMLK